MVLGKLGGKLALGLIQIGFAMLAGTVFFGMDWGGQLGAIIAVMIVYGALMATVGVVLGCLARSEGIAAAIGVIGAGAAPIDTLHRLIHALGSGGRNVPRRRGSPCPSRPSTPGRMGTTGYHVTGILS